MSIKRMGIALLSLASLVFSACGGGAGGSGGGASSGGGDAPSGAIATGLQTAIDGWSFPNFPSSSFPDVNFDETDLVSMFGSDETICVGGVAEPCKLTAEAAAWARMVNQSRASGHCEGLVALASSRFNNKEQPATVKLPSQEETLRAVIRTFATQFLPEVQDSITKWAAASFEEKIDELKKSFAAGALKYTLGVYTQGGGHALLPYAIEYPTPDTPRVMLYDSNWPGKNRYVDIDLKAKTWRFSFSGADPANDPDAWTGGPQDMDLTPLDARQGTCPFCGKDVKAAKTTMLIRSANLDWSVEANGQSVKPGGASSDGSVAVKPVKGFAFSSAAGSGALKRESYDYLVEVKNNVGASGTTTTSADKKSTSLNFTGATAVFALTEAGIAQFTTPGTSGAPITMTSNSISTKDPGVDLTLASGNLVANASGSAVSLSVEGGTMAVSVTAPNGQVIEQQVSAEQPTLQMKVDEAGGGITVLAASASGVVQKTEVSATGETTKSVVTEALNLSGVKAELPPALASKEIAALPSLADRDMANPNYKVDAAYTAPTTIPAKSGDQVAEAVPTSQAKAQNAVTSNEPGPTTPVKNAASPTTLPAKGAAPVDDDAPPTTVKRTVAAATSGSATGAAVALKPSLGRFSIPGVTFGDAAFTIDEPSSNSSGGWKFTSSKPDVVEVSSLTGRATIKGAGTTIITATQSAVKGFEQASITAFLIVGRDTPVLGAYTTASRTFGDDSFTLKNPTSNSPGAFTVESSDESVAKFSKTSGKLVIAGAGKTTISATQSATDDYLAGLKSFVLTVKKATPELGAFDDIARTFGEAGFTLAKPTSDSRAAFSLSSSNPTVATIDGASGAVTIVGAGTTSFTASQAANDDFFAASKAMTFTVRQATPTLGVMAGASKTFGDAAFALAKPSSPSSGAFSFSSSNTGVASVDADGKVTVVGAGTSTITATQAASGNYTASSAAAVVTVGRAATTIANLSLSNMTYGASDVTLAPRSNNPSPFTFTSSAPNVLAVNATTGRVSVVSAGTATITVRQASSTNYEAGSESLTAQIGRATPTLSSFSAISKDYGDTPFALTPPESSSSGAYSYASSNTAVATVNASTGVVTIVGIGSSTVTAAQAQTENYLAGTAITTLTVGRGTPVFGDFAIASKLWGSSDFTLAPPTSTSAAAFTYSIVDVDGVNESAIATVTSSGTVTVVGVGTVQVRATQAANTLYVSSSITATFTVTVPKVSSMGLSYSSCGLTEGGGLKCWGYNNYGQVGDGTTINRSGPVYVTGLTSGANSVATGLGHTCATLSAGGVKCWGYNTSGQLGDGTTTNRTSPVVVSNLTSNVASVVTGGYHTCALTVAGGVKCWGANNYGQLGDGTTTSRTTPIDVSGLTTGVVSISSRGNSTCAILISGGLKCWGANNFGQIGDGTTTNRTTPVDVANLTSGITMVASGWENTCAVSASGGVKCWGYNVLGQLGDGTTTNRTSPVDVVGLSSGVTSIAEGWEHKCVIMSTGGVKCWGHNANGSVGDGTTTNRTAPVDVPSLQTGVVSIAAGGHTCVLMASGAIKCWGYNGFGQLGDGSTTSRSVPVDVPSLSSSLKARPIYGAFDLPLSATTSIGSSFALNAPSSTSSGAFAFESSNTDVATVNSVTGNVTIVGFGSTILRAVQLATDAYSSGTTSLSLVVVVPTPTTFTSVLGPDRVDLGWSYSSVDSAAITDFVVEYSTSSTFASYSTFADGISTANTARVTGLTDLTWYYFRVRAVTASGSTSARSAIQGLKYTIQNSVTGVNTGSVRQLAASSSTSCVLYMDGRVRCWGQANPGTNISNATFVDVGRGAFACALLDTAQVKCWGSNGNGELGRGFIGGRDNTPALVVGLTDVTQISVGEGHACALLSSGAMKCWGNNTNQPGKLGDGTSTNTGTPVTVTTAGFTNIRAMKLLSYDTCILKWDGTVKCIINYGISPSLLTDGVTISGSYITLCIKTSTNRIKCTGTTGYSSSYSATTPIEGLTDVVDFARSIYGVCAVVTSGKVLCVGSTGLYEDPEFTNAVSMGSSWDSAYCVLDATDHVRCKGTQNGSPGYGVGTNAGANSVSRWIYVPEIGSPLPASSNAYLGMMAHGSSTCVPVEAWNSENLNYTATLASWETSCNLMPVREERHALLEVNGTYVEPNNYSTLAVPVATGVNTITFRVVAQDLVTTRIYTLRVTRLPALAMSATSISANHNHTTCITNSSGSLKCTGYNNYGQLGNGTTTDAKWLQFVPQMTSGMKQVSLGYQHACGLTTLGGVKCWGYNGYGALGDGTTTNRTSPVDVVGLSSGVAALASTANSTCALMADSGGVKCWGYNGDGLVGDGTTISRSTPVDVVGLTSGVASLSGGHAHICAVTTLGGAMCWGWNIYGILGNGSAANSSSTPVQVTGLTSGVKAIAAGTYHTCAVMTSGSVKCWGYNAWGNFGNGTTTDSNSPVDSGVADVNSISAGEQHTCVVTTSGAAKCVGGNGYGQLGDGTTVTKGTFVDVSGLSSGVAMIETGGHHTCSILVDLTAKCWGRNEYGQLGDNTRTTRTTPVNLPDNGIPS